MYRLLCVFATGFLFTFGCNDGQLSGFDPSSPPPPVPTGGVEGTYRVEANPSQQNCGNVGVTTFYATQVVITVDGNQVFADWGLASAPGITEYTEPQGTLDQARFLMTWTYSQLATNGFTTDYDTSWNGDFTADGLVSHLQQDIRIQGGLAGSCNLLWQVVGTKM